MAASRDLNTMDAEPFHHQQVTCSGAGAVRSSSFSSLTAHSWCALYSGQKTAQNHCRLAQREDRPPEGDQMKAPLLLRPLPYGQFY